MENHLGAEDRDDEERDSGWSLTERYQVVSGAEKGTGSRPCVCGVGEVGTGIGEVSSNQLEETELPTPSGSQLDSLW